MDEVKRLRTVLIPCLASDLAALEFLLNVWKDPRFRPGEPEETRDLSLVVLVNNGTEETLRPFADLLAAQDELDPWFPERTVVSAGLTGDADLYSRNPTVRAGTYGNKAGPNNMFFTGLQTAQGRGGFLFQCELDCFPLMPGWLAETDALIAQYPSAWVIGSNYVGQHLINPSSAYHINGNALYQVGDPRFMAFALNVWRRNLLASAEQEFNLAYDCWMEDRRTRGASRGTGLAWHWSVAFHSRFSAVPFVINLLKLKTIREDMQSAEQIERLSGYRHLFFHAAYSGKLYAAFLQTDRQDIRAFLGAYVR